MVAPHVLCRQFLLAGTGAGQHVLDVGCGQGGLMLELTRSGCAVKGVEIDPALVQSCVGLGLHVFEGRAEELPFADNSFDAIVCSVVVPYTDERKVVAEWARVLKPGGLASATFHGIGYGLRYLFRGPGWARRFYGARMLANTICYGMVGQRLPNPLGDTLCQTSRRLRSYYDSFGLSLEQHQVVGTVAGAALYLCHRAVKKRATAVAG